MDRSNNIPSTVHFQFRFIPRMLLELFSIFARMVRKYMVTDNRTFFNNSITVVFHYIENQDTNFLL